MRIKRAENAVDGRGEELAIIRLVDIVGPHGVQELAEQFKLSGDFDAGRRVPDRPTLGLPRNDSEHEQGGARRCPGDDFGQPQHGILPLSRWAARRSQPISFGPSFGPARHSCTVVYLCFRIKPYKFPIIRTAVYGDISILSM